MKTLVIIAIAGALATGVLKQNLIEFNPKAALEIPSKIEDKIEFTRCYKREFDARHTTGRLPADGARVCHAELKTRHMLEALAAHRYEDL